MARPILITFHNLPHSDALESALREKAGQLEKYNHDLQSCRAVVEVEGRHKQHGHIYRVHLCLHLPGQDVAVSRESSEDPYLAARDAFEAARRALEEAGARRHPRMHVRRAADVPGGSEAASGDSSATPDEVGATPDEGGATPDESAAAPDRRPGEPE
jgi:ribosomal subunit interface protein